MVRLPSRAAVNKLEEKKHAQADRTISDSHGMPELEGDRASAHGSLGLRKARGETRGSEAQTPQYRLGPVCARGGGGCSDQADAQPLGCPRGEDGRGGCGLRIYQGQ